ncbi:MAG: FeoA domain-containing protein [Bacillota bacterium]|nr:FeoA domain-containing protein [Bacillota bacterium]
MTLNELDINKSCYIKSLRTEGEARRRMLDLGLVEGTKIQAAFRAPFGEPVAYFVRGTLIALRREDTIKIDVEREQENE